MRSSDATLFMTQFQQNPKICLQNYVSKICMAIYGTETVFNPLELLVAFDLFSFETHVKKEFF